MLDFGYIGLSFIGILVACILLLSFVMLASRWIKNYIISFTLQAWLLGAIALMIGIHNNNPGFYILGIISILIRGILLPFIFKKTLRTIKDAREQNIFFQAGSNIIICLIFLLFSSFVAVSLVGKLDIKATQADTMIIAFSAMCTIFLNGFFMLTTRHYAISKVIALLMIENGALVGSMLLVPSVTVFVSIMVLFDLFIAVISFHLLSKFLMEQWESSDNRLLKKLVG